MQKLISYFFINFLIFKFFETNINHLINFYSFFIFENNIIIGLYEENIIFKKKRILGNSIIFIIGFFINKFSSEDYLHTSDFPALNFLLGGLSLL